MLFVLAFYYLLPDKWKVRFLLLVSYVFYGFWDPSLCSLIACALNVLFA